ncbi:MAG TPA: hypothetical protein VL463_16740 [Kofleriaceae bacterium]|jgi:hypothetical protein|nr:hypothetical protein [Kofleriaceae bacterium]
MSTPEPGTSRKRPIVRWLLVALWCAVLFLVPSAALIDRGAPLWAAAIAGVASFPIAPIAWQVIAERARKRRVAAMKIAPKATLTAGDRFVFRTIAVALLTCAPWFVVARGRTLRAVWHHATWPVDWISSGEQAARFGTLHVTTDRKLLQYVPSDAEAIIWLRAAPDLTKLGKSDESKDEQDKDDDGFVQGVLALKKGELFAVVQAKKLDDIKPDAIDQEEAKKWFGHELHFKQHRIADDTLVIVTEDWDQAYVDRVAGKSPAATALIDKLGPAPADAVIAAAAIPRETIADLTLRDAIAWLRVDAESQKLAARATIHTIDAAAAAHFKDDVDRALAQAKRALPDSCREPVGALIDGIHVTTKGDEVSIDTTVAPDQIAGAMFCALAKQ